MDHKAFEVLVFEAREAQRHLQTEHAAFQLACRRLNMSQNEVNACWEALAGKADTGSGPDVARKVPWRYWTCEDGRWSPRQCSLDDIYEEGMELLRIMGLDRIDTIVLDHETTLRQDDTRSDFRDRWRAASVARNNKP